MIRLKVTRNQGFTLSLEDKNHRGVSPVVLGQNLLGNSHTSQFEDCNYKYDMIKEFLNSNADFGKYSASFQTL